ncbi:MAG: hypothetical protein ACM3KE_12050 [Hyphomicrobiales bacterium]
MSGVRGTVKTNMLEAGVDKIYRDRIPGHSPGGMDRHHIKPSEGTQRKAMAHCIAWLDEQLENVDPTVDQETIESA